MTRQIAPDQIDSSIQAFVHVRETLRIIIPGSPSSLEKFAHSAVGFEVRLAGDVTAITTALDHEKLRPGFLRRREACENATMVRLRFCYICRVRWQNRPPDRRPPPGRAEI